MGGLIPLTAERVAQLPELMRLKDERTVCAQLAAHADGMTVTDVFFGLGVGGKFRSPVRIKAALDRLVEKRLVFVLPVVSQRWTLGPTGMPYCQAGAVADLYYLGPPPTPDVFSRDDGAPDS